MPSETLTLWITVLLYFAIEQKHEYTDGRKHDGGIFTMIFFHSNSLQKAEHLTYGSHETLCSPRALLDQ